MKKGKTPEIRSTVTYRSLLKDLKRLPEDRREAFQGFLRGAEREEEMELNHEFAAVVEAVMEETAVDLLTLRNKAPRGFWNTVIERLNEQGITRPRGEEWTLPAEASNHWKRHMGEISGLIAQVPGEEDATEEESPVTLLPDVSERSEAFVPMEVFEQAIGELRAILDELRKEIASHQKDQSGSGQYPDLSPLTPMEGKKFKGHREKLGVTLDKVLMEKLEEESRARGINMSRLIDTVVWNYYARPQLSFETEGEAQKEEEM